MGKGGKRAGAGRPKGDPTTTVRVPLSMMRAVQALQSIARGDGTQRDIAEIMIAINADGRTEQWGGIIGHEEISKARRQANDAATKDFDAELMKDAADLGRRAEAIGCGRI